MRLFVKSATICILLTVSCASRPSLPTLEIDVCAILIRDNAPICRCTKPSGEMYSLTIERCAEQKYNAFSPEDAALLYEYLFNLKDELNGCRGEK